MGPANVISHIDLRRRLKQAQQLANQIMFARERVFCDATLIALVSSPHLPPGANGQQAIVVDGGSIRFNRDLDT